MQFKLSLARLMLASGLLSAGVAIAADPFSGPLYVTLQGANAVEVLPQGVVWNGITAAHYDDVSADGQRVLVTSARPGQVYIMDAATGKQLAVLATGESTQGVKIAPDGRLALVVDPDAGNVVVVDITQLKITKTIPVGKTPHNVRFSDDGALAYVTLQGGGGVAIVNMRTLEKTGDIPLPTLNSPHNLDLSDHGRLLWVRDIVNHVAVVDLKTKKVLHTIKVGNGHGGIDVIPGGRYVFTGAIGDHVVDVIDARTYKVIRQIDVGVGPHGVRASRDGRWVYAEITSTNKVAIIDTHALKVIKQVETAGGLPFWGAVAGND